MRTIRRYRAIACVVGFAILFFSVLGRAGDATWLANPATGIWNTSTNWTPATVPNGVNESATFSTSATTTVTLSADVYVSSITFNAGASSYMFTPLQAKVLIIDGAGIVNNSGVVQNFVPEVTSNTTFAYNAPIEFTNSASAGSLVHFTLNGAPDTVSFFGASATFLNASSAGTATFTVNGGTGAGNSSVGVAGALLGFSGSSTASFGTFVSNGGASGADGGDINFSGQSTASHGNFTANGAIVSGGYGGNVDLTGFAIADHATFVNNGVGISGGLHGGGLRFDQFSTAGNSSVTNNGGTVSSGGGGATIFQSFATGGNATFTNNGGTVSGALGGSIHFQNDSSAASGTYISHSATVDGAGGGQTIFDIAGGFPNSTAVAGQGQFFNFGAVTPNAGAGLTSFTSLTSADHGTFNNYGASALGVGGSGGQTAFHDTSTAANGTFLNSGATVAGGLGGTTQFFDSSTAGTATITNNGSTLLLTGAGMTIFHNTSTAGSATITSQGSSLAGGGLLGGQTQFADTASAGTATLIAQGGTAGGDGGVISLSGSSTASTARIEVFGNGTLDISSHASPGASINTLEGDGIAFLGSRTITVGASGGSSTFSGSLRDGGQGGGTGGQLNKIGVGTFTVAGTNNTFTGVTTVGGGTLLVDGVVGTAVSGVSVSGGTLGGTGIVHGGASVGNAGAFAPGDLGGPGTFTLDSLTFSNLSNLNYRLGTPNVVGANVNDLATVNGFLGIDGVLNITNLSGFGIGTYRLFNYTGSLSDVGLNIGNVPLGYTYAVDKTIAQQINLNVTSNGQVIFWNGTHTTANGSVNGGTGIWDSSNNWTDAAGAGVGSFNGTGVFVGTAGTVTLGANVTFHTLDFRTTGYLINADGGNTFTLITPDGATSIATDTGVTATINAPITGANGILIKNGPGTLILNGVNTYGGDTVNGVLSINTIINAGTLQLGDATHVAALKGDVINSSIFNIVNANTSAITDIDNAAGATTTFFNSTTISGQIRNFGAAAAGGSPGQTIFRDNSSAGSVITIIDSKASVSGGAGGLTVFRDTSTAGSATLQTSGGTPGSASNGEIRFMDQSNAGSSSIVSGDINSQEGYVRFYDNSSAANAHLFNQYYGLTVFYDSSTAGNATMLSLNNNLDFNGVPTPGGVQFRNNSRAGTASITVTSGSSGVTVILGGIGGRPLTQGGGLLDFYDNSSADHAAITMTTSALVTFHDHSTAGNAVITETPVSQEILQFLDQSTAGNATINVGASTNTYFDDRSTAGNATFNITGGGIVMFKGGSTAGNAIINNVAANGWFTGGSVGFEFDSTTGNATIFNDDQVTFAQVTPGAATITDLSGGTVTFETFVDLGNITIFNKSGATVHADEGGTGVTTVIVNDAGATLDVSSSLWSSIFPTVNIGSVSGRGNIVLGNRTLIVGALNLNETISGNITDSGMGGSFTKMGSGTLTLSGVNSYTGLTTVQQGTLKVGSSTALVVTSGLDVFKEATLDLNGFSTTIGSLGDGTTGGGTITNTANTPATLTAGGGNASAAFSGTLTNGASSLSFVKTGTGTQVLSGTSTYTGATQVNAGTLQVDGELGNTTTTVASGATLGGVGSIGGPVTIQNGGILAPGDSPGTITVASLILNASSILNYQLGISGVIGGGVNDLTEVTGALTLDGTLNITPLTGFGAGVYRIIDYGGALTNNVLLMGTAPSGHTYSVTAAGGQVNLLVDAGSLSYWDGPNITANNVVDGGTDIWNNGLTNWTNSTGSINAQWNNLTAIFSGTAGTATLGANISLQGMQFTVDSYIINPDAGHTFSLKPSGTATVSTGTNVTATINAPFTGTGGLTFGGTGTVVLTGASSIVGDLTVNGGTLKITSGGTFANAFGYIGVDAGSHATVTVDGAGSAWNPTKDVTVGVSGTGTLNIQNGGSVTLTTSRSLTLGANTGSSGTVNVDGTGSPGGIFLNLISFGLTVGDFGTGVLNIKNGGTVESIFVTDVSTLGFGVGSSGTATVDGVGSKWTTIDGLIVSKGGAGNLSITHGGLVSSSSGAAYIGSQGTVTVDGAGSTWNVGGIAVGFTAGSGTASLAITNGGQVTSSGDITIGNNATALNAKGKVTVSDHGSSLSATGVVTLGLEGGTGTLQILNGAGFSADNLVLGAGSAQMLVDGNGSTATITGSDGISMTGTPASLTVQNGGSVIVQGGTGTISMAPFSGNNTVINIGDGNAAGSVQAVTITGGAGSAVLYFNFTDASYTIAPSMTGSIAVNLLSKGATTFTGANTYSGTTNLSAGTLHAGTTASFSPNSTFQVNSGAILDAAGFSNTLGALADGTGGGGSVTNSGITSAVLSIGKNNASTTFSGVIQDGAGGLAFTKIGSGALNLTGANTYTGATNVNAGTLRVNGSLVAASIVTVNNGGTLGGAGIIHGPVTIMSGGTLAPGNSPGTLTVASLVLNSGSMLSYELGTPNVVGAGVNDLTEVTGDLTLGGTLNIMKLTGFGAGVYRILDYGGILTNNTLSLGSVPLGYTYAVDVSTKDEVNLDVSGLGIVPLNVAFWNGRHTTPNGRVNGGSGIWTNTGSNWTDATGTVPGMWGGLTAVFAGAPGTVMLGDNIQFQHLDFVTTGYVVQSPRFALITAGASTINTAEGVTATIQAPIVGPGSLVKNGVGTLDLTGASSIRGPTTINAGSLLVDGSLGTSHLYVNPGGLLGGNGYVNGNVVNSGTVSPGDSPGVLHINGNYVQTSGGALVIQINSVHSFDRLVINGHARLSGTLDLATGSGFKPQRGQSFTVLTATDGISGHFGNIINPFPKGPGNLVYLGVDYTANAVIVEALQNTFKNALSLFKLTPNQVAVAAALDSALFDARQNNVLDYLDNSDITTVPHQLDRIAPEELTTIYTLAFAQLDSEVLSVQQRLMDIRAAKRNAASSNPQEEVRSAEVVDKEPVSTNLPAEDHGGFFLTATGDFASMGDTYNANGFNSRSAGTTLGADLRLSEHFILGLTLSYQRTDSDLTEGGRLRVEGGKAALYGMYQRGGFFSEGLIGGGYNSYDTLRTALDGTARGSTQGGQFDAYYGVGYDQPVGPVVLTPIASALYSVVGMGSFTETGSLEPLHLDAQSESSLRSQLGLRVAHTGYWQSANITTSLSAQWQHEFLDDELAIDSSFANGAGSPFTVHGPKSGRDSALLTAAVNVTWSRYAAYAAYQADLGRQDYQNQTMLLGFRVSW